MLAHNIKILTQHGLGGHGSLGEGMSMQIAKDGRRILWLAHESAPMNFTGVDVSDPASPRVVVERTLPHMAMRSNSLETVEDLMAIAYQAAAPGGQPAGIELFDISNPEDPHSISFIDCSGPHSRGVHQLWFVDGRYIHASAGSVDFVPRNRRDDQFYRVFDIANPTAPRLACEWWMPGTREGDGAPPPTRLERFDFGIRVHNTNVYPERPDRAYLGYLDAGMVVLDISDMARPREVCRWSHHPPFLGFTHTVLPLFERNLLIVTDETVVDDAKDWPKLAWVLDTSDERNPVPLSSLPIPEPKHFPVPKGRYGAHNLHENRPGPAWRSDTLIFGTYFAGGIRVHDISDAANPREVAFCIPDAPPDSPAEAIQINDVFVDDRGIVFAVDRSGGGLFTMELTL